MGACASKSGDAAALRPEEQHAASASSEVVAAKIELSKRHWSELSEPIGDGITREDAAKAKLDNQKAFRIWELHPKWSDFFKRFEGFGDHSDHGKVKAKYDNEDAFKIWQMHPHDDIFKSVGYPFRSRQIVGSIKVGEKFAEGGQAELFNARVYWGNFISSEVDEEGCECVLKVFKEGSLVRDLQRQWPQGLFCRNAHLIKLRMLGKPGGTRNICEVFCATLLEDGRFAFLMVKEDGDLRSLIDDIMAESDHGCGPFSKVVGEEIMYRVAKGMNELHSYDIVHRDLKASNVLVRTYLGVKWAYCYVADFESSVGVVGTGFWRAPEILRALREKDVGKRPELFSREADSYSFGMTCYEVLTGKVPFEDHPLRDQCSTLTNLVIDQDVRPEVPGYVEDWAQRLLEWCWKSDCARRPSFKEILGFLEANSNSKFISKEVSKRRRAECRMPKSEVQIGYH